MLEVAVEEVAVEEVAELVVLAVALVVLVVVLVTVDRVELVVDVIVTVTPDTPKPSEFFHANTKFNRSKLPLSVLRNLSNIREMTAECNGKLCKYYTKLIQIMIFNMQNYVNMSMKTIMIMTHLWLEIRSGFNSPKAAKVLAVVLEVVMEVTVIVAVAVVSEKFTGSEKADA